MYDDFLAIIIGLLIGAFWYLTVYYALRYLISRLFNPLRIRFKKPRIEIIKFDYIIGILFIGLLLNYYNEFELLIIQLFGGVIISFMFSRKVYNPPPPSLSDAGFFLGFFTVIVFFLSLLLAVMASKRVMESTKKFKIDLIDGGVITTGDEIKFIGETKQYIFLQNTVELKTSIVPRARIKQLEYYNERNLKDWR